MKTIVIANAKGGVAKTTTALHLAVGFAGKCQNSGRATMTVLIFPTWWTIAAKYRQSAAHEGTTNRLDPHFSSDAPDFLRLCTAF